MPVALSDRSPPSRHATSHARHDGGRRRAELVKQYCTGCHNDRSKAGELTLAGWNVTRASARARAHRKDDPQAARRHDAAERRAAARAGADRAAGHRARIAHGRARRGRPESGLAAVPATEPRRVRARDPEPARSRRRRDGVPARRHDQRRLRQRRRRADVLADADGRLPARRQPHRDAGDRRSRRLGDAGDLQAAEDGVADGARRGRAARHPRRHLGRAHVRRRRRLRVQHGLLRRAARLPVRQHRGPARRSRCRSTARGSRCSRSTRA